MTDLQHDLGDAEDELSKERKKNLHLSKNLEKYKKELVNARRTLVSYRKIVAGLQKNSLSKERGDQLANMTEITLGSAGGQNGRKQEPSGNHDVLHT